MSFIKSIINGASLQHHFTSALILAGGIGSRFGNEDGTKQLAAVSGIPALVRSCMAFEECPLIDETVIVARREETEIIKELTGRYELKKVAKIVEGGNTRAESSANGAAAVSDKCKFIAIHDAARCLVTAKIVEDTVISAYRYGSAAAAERAVDTVKIADENGFIERTENRDYVWLVKTPQVFKRSIYDTASALTQRDGVEVTDDCMMAEHAGFKVKLVDCGSENIKLTTRDDLAVAEYIISKREGGLTK
ncbi:MAG: 2-C-methyl-D-erythritol 4-phosphate cytidylyltransferase [Clostridia bacterium]|nr:2-C-methyl-D-erythritol 4-phosphate cytidylyltransferase [Clostridia bacterium]